MQTIMKAVDGWPSFLHQGMANNEGFVCSANNADNKADNPIMKTIMKAIADCIVCFIVCIVCRLSADNKCRQ